MNNLIIFAQQAASTAPTTPQGQGATAIAAGSQWGSILLMLGIFVVFYLVLILPESRRRKKLQKEISAMKIGDKVITSAGITGTIDFIGDKTVYIKSLDAKFEIAKESIAAVIK
jgi:preprotein translocase subunit YajC